MIYQHTSSSTCRNRGGQTYTRTIKVLARRTIKYFPLHSQKHRRTIEPVEGEECSGSVCLENDGRRGFGDVGRSRGAPAEIDQVDEEGDEDEIYGCENGGTGVGLVCGLEPWERRD